MLTVLFNWGYIFVTAFLIGFAVLLPFERGGAAAGRAQHNAASDNRMVRFIIINTGIYDKYNAFFQTFLLSSASRRHF